MLIPGRKSRGEFCSELKEHSELCDWNEELKAPVIFEWNGNFCINIIFWINGFLKLPPPWRLFCWIAKIHQSRSSLRSFFIYSNLAKRYATGNLTFIIKHPLRIRTNHAFQHPPLRLVSRLGLHLISHHVTHNHLRRLLLPKWLSTPHSAQLSPQGTDSLFMSRQNPVNNPQRIYQYVTGWRDRYAR